MDRSLSEIRGIGPARLKALNDAGIHTARDLAMLLPRDYRDLTEVTPLGALQAGVPVVPVYHGYDYRFFHRTPVVIGKPMDLSAECPTQNPGPEELKRLTALLRGKIVELREMAEK